jgi:hypothetical protein
MDAILIEEKLVITIVYSRKVSNKRGKNHLCQAVNIDVTIYINVY